MRQDARKSDQNQQAGFPKQSAGQVHIYAPANGKESGLLSCRQLLMSFRDREFRPEHLERDTAFFVVHQRENM